MANVTKMFTCHAFSQ